MRWILVVGCALVLAPAAASQLHARMSLSHTAKHHTLVAMDGERLRAQVLDVENDDVRLKVFVGGGETTIRRKIADFDAESQLFIRAAVMPQDADSYLALSREAADEGLLGPARQGLAHARMLADDPTIGADVEAAMHAARAKKLEAQFEQDLRVSQVSRARSVLATLEHRYSDVVPADKVKSMEGEIDALLTVKAQTYQSEKEAAERKRAADRRRHLMKPVEKLVAAAEKNHDKALKASPASSKSKNFYNFALQESERALKIIESLEKKHGDDQELMAQVAVQRDNAMGILRSTLLDSGSRALMHGQLNVAMSNVNRILAHDPNDRQALAMRARVEMAGNRGLL